jgi:hypothetical protein
MLWKIRCIIAWSFRVLGCVAVLIASIASLYFAIHDSKAFNTVFPPGSFTLPILIIGLLLVFELLGRLLSWTDPLDNLPRFQDEDKWGHAKTEGRKYEKK